MRRLPIGVPKVMVSTVASGDVKPYVGPSDICMMYSVTDVAGINRISEKVLANAAHALAGMLAFSRSPAPSEAQSKPALGLTMFGLTTPCVQAVCKQLEAEYDCLVFHATGTGGQSMEKLADSGLLAGVLDITTTEVADEIVGGVLTAGPSRMDVFARAGDPLRRLVRRPGHGQLLGQAHRPCAIQGPEPARAQPERHADADDARRGGTHRPVHRRQAQSHGGSGALPDPRGRALGPRPPGRPVLGPGGEPGTVRRHRLELPRRDEPEAAEAPHHINDPAFADALVATFNEIRTPWPELRVKTS